MIAPIILCVCNLVVIAVPLVVVVGGGGGGGRYLQDWHHSAVVGSREVVEAGESHNQQTID